MLGLSCPADDPSDPGKAVQVDPINPTLKAPGVQRLKLKYEELLSNFGVKFNSRRYTPGRSSPTSASGCWMWYGGAG